MNWALWLTPLVGALIGWFTNYLAVKMIFRPQKPIKIPVTGIVLQGLIPKRKAEIAGSLGKVIERELISLEDLAGRLSDQIRGERLISLLAVKSKDAVISSLPTLTPEPVKVIAGNLVEGIVKHQAPELISQFTAQALEELKKNLSLSQVIEEKVNEMEWETLEELVLEIASRELKHIEYLGALIGFLIGVVQLALVVFL